MKDFKHDTSLGRLNEHKLDDIRHEGPKGHTSINFLMNQYAAASTNGSTAQCLKLQQKKGKGAGCTKHA